MKSGAAFVSLIFAVRLGAQSITTGSMQVPREAHTATLLNNGLVLVAGGITSETNEASTPIAEIYNPQTGAWRYTGIGSQTYMIFPAGYHTATKLIDGRVLIAGGAVGLNAYTNAAEIFDPATEFFTPTNGMNDVHGAHDAVLLNDGRVLVVGGYQSPNSSPGTAEIWDPNTGQWSVSNSNLGSRVYLAITRLLDGRVLVTGGESSNRVDLFDPASNTWQPMTPLLYNRWTHSASTLPNGKVLVVGGGDVGGAASSTAELYDVSANGGLGSSTLVPGGLTIGATKHSAAQLPNGDVFLAGGIRLTVPCGYAGAVADTQLYNYDSGTFSTESPLLVSRTFFSMTLLPSGQILSAGGNNAQCSVNNILNQAELWGAATPATGTITVTTNLPAAAFTISGPATYNGSGTSFTQTNAPPGPYKISYNPVAKYITPPSQSGTLLAGQTLQFTAAYTPVTLTVCPTAPPGCAQSLSFSAQQGNGHQTAPQQLAITSNLPGISFAATATTNPADGPWIAIGPANFGTTPATLTITVASNLKAGTYPGTLSISSTGATNSPQVLSVTLLVTKGPPPQTITISSIDGWSSNPGVSQAQWQGQPIPPAKNHGKYYLFYAIDTPVKTTPSDALPANVTVWKIHGSGFGSQRGNIIFSDTSINSISSTSSAILYWAPDGTEVDIVPSFVTSFNYRQNTNVFISIAGSVPLLLPKPSGLPPNTQWNSGVIGMIRGSRGFGQCTWYVANVRLNNNLSIPAPSAYTSSAIDSQYVPQLWDVLDFDKSHSAIIISQPARSQVFNPSDGSTTYTFAFTIGEMNYDLEETACNDTAAGCIQGQYVLKVPKTGSITATSCTGCTIVLPNIKHLTGSSGIISKAYKTISASTYFR